MSSDNPVAMNRRRVLLIAIPLLVLVVAVVGPFVYINFVKEDAAAELSLDDVTTLTTAAGATATTASGTTTGVFALEGSWKVESGTAGYRVGEVLFGQDAEATGRTTKVTGTMTVAGTSINAASFSVDLASVSSGESQRDGQFRNRIMSTGRFPTATFELTKPITLTSVPADGQRITVSVPGRFTIHGVTKSVTFDLLAQRNGATIALNGTVPMKFADYDINDPSGGPAKVKDNAEMEFLLVLARS
jgi:polyisoprenoid-binding protein YceI